MALRLNAWLAETFEWQLVLANHWLQERHEKKKSGVKIERDRAWDGLYHHNGSCLEIINHIHSDRNSALQVLEARPWTLTDGRHHIVADLTPDCARDFATRYPAVSYLSPGSTIAVRKYTLQSTSYGPPRRRLRFLLHHIEWVGVSCHLTNVDLVPLYHQGAIVAVQEQLRETRAREDHRCLSVGEAQTNDTMARNLHQSRVAPNSGSQPTSQMLNTQAPFGTQLQHPTRAYPDSDESSDPDESQSLGTDRLEPMTLGNRITKSVEIRPEQGATQYEQEQQLLSLLKVPVEKNRPTTSALQVGFTRPKEHTLRQPPSQSTAREKRWIQNAFARVEPSLDQGFFNEENLKPENLGPDVQDTAPPPWEVESRVDVKDEPRSPKSLENSGKEAFSRVSKDKEATDSAEGKGDRAARIVPEQDTASSPECSWMKGFIFNSETLKVSRLQQQCLTKESSWLHPPPGRPPFQDGNMPQAILATLHMFADERANAEDDETSNNDSDIDPSPDSLPVITTSSAESVPQNTQENDESDEGVISDWNTSPETSPRPLRSHQDLPPDTSPVTQKSGVDQSSKIFPTSSINQPQHPEVVDISDGEPLAVQKLAISDDDIEMEECIPQALGEDLTEKIVPRTDIPAISSPSPNPTQPQSVVQVSETPYGKGKTAQRLDGNTLYTPVSKQIPNSSDESANKSSSIVHSTSNPQSLSSAEVAQNPTNKSDTTRTDQRMVSQVRREPHDKIARTEVAHSSEDVQMVAELLETEETARLSNTAPKPLSPQGLAPASYSNTPQVASRSTKRKSPASPARGNQRRSKRREIRIVGFGDMTPPTVDPRIKLREDREESLRRYREELKSGTSSEGLHQTTRALVDKQGMDAMDLDSAGMLGNEAQSDRRSPGHDSLYEEPSPRPVRPDVPMQSPPFHGESQLRDQPRSSQAKHRSNPSLQPQQTSAGEDEASHKTVFEAFKAAYPEYTGDKIHFRNKCKEMHQLDLEDKMVPKWQWDDFIIRDRTDYRDYALKCIDRAENLEPYHRFYKDNIRDTLYRKGILKGRQTLERVLAEVGNGVKDMDTPGQPPIGPPLKPSSKPISKPLSSRKSLSGSFDQTRKPRNGSAVVSHARPRQSFPASLGAQQPSQQGTPSASRLNTLREQPRTPRPSKPEPTGDAYLEFWTAYKQNVNKDG